MDGGRLTVPGIPEFKEIYTMEQARKALRDLVELGKEHGYITLEEINRSLTNASMSSEEIDSLMGTLGTWA